MALVISRRRGERIRIGKDIEVMVSRIIDGTVRLAIRAPKEVLIARDELLTRKEAATDEQRH